MARPAGRRRFRARQSYGCLSYGPIGISGDCTVQTPGRQVRLAPTCSLAADSLSALRLAVLTTVSDG